MNSVGSCQKEHVQKNKTSPAQGKCQEEEEEMEVVDDGEWEPSSYQCVACSKVCYSKQKVSRYKGNPLKLVNVDRTEENFICKGCLKTAKKRGLIAQQNEKDIAMENFLSSCDEMPCYVCTCCHRVLFRKGVRKFKRSLYECNTSSRASIALSDRFRYRKKDGKEFICTTCHLDLRKDKIPCQAVANNLQIDDVPKVIDDLTHLEMRCISLRIPFMKIYALRKGGQGKIDGPCVNVPATMEPIVEILPRLPKDLKMIMLKLKRKLQYKSHHIFDFIRPQRVMMALEWLKIHNPHYANVRIDVDWLDKIEDDPLNNVVLGQQREHHKDNSENINGDGKSNIEMSEKVHDAADTQPETVIEQQQCDQSDNNEPINPMDQEAHETSVEEDENDNSVCMDKSKKELEEEFIEQKTFEEEQKEVDRKADITIEPSSTCLQYENIEQRIFSIAPGEYSAPRFILMDNDFETLSFVKMFPFGTGGFEVKNERPRHLDLRRYINQRLLNVVGKFSQDLEYIFALQYASELKQLRSEMFMALRKVSQNAVRLTAGQMMDSDFVQSLVLKDLAYKFMKNVRGTPAYWQGQLFDTLAMLRTFGTPTFFLTLSAAEFLWPQFIMAIGRRNGIKYSEDDVCNMTWNEKAKLLRGNPVVTVQMFQHRLDAFFQDFIMSKANPLGKVKEYCIKIEFQARGSPHGHCLIWTEDAPRIDTSSDAEVEQFCDEHMCGALPEDTEANQELRELVERLQKHVHSSFCRKHINAPCRFNFPRPPIFKSVVARSKNESPYVEVDPKVKREVLQSVRSAVEKDPDQTTTEVLNKANIEPELYVQCLQESKKGANVLLKREPNEMFINNYNKDIIRLWRANMDLQFVADPYSAVMYVLSYVLKAEKGMSEVLKQAAKEYESGGMREQMKQIASAFSNKREVSIQEAIMRVLSMWLFKKTTQVIFVSNVEKELRTRMPKPKIDLMAMDPNDTNIFMLNIHDRYENRPPELENYCLAKFAANYVPCGSSARNCIELQNNMGHMKKRKKAAVIRTHRFPDHTSEFYHGKLLLFWPWRVENEIKRPNETFQEKYNSVFDIVEANAKPFNLDRKDIDAAFDDFIENGIEPSDWELAHKAECDKAKQNGHSNEEENIYVDENVAADVATSNDEDEDEVKHPLISLYRTESRKKSMDTNEYFEAMRKLNVEQREIVDFNRKWIKEQILRLKQGKKLEGYRVFLSGPGGTGKSMVIRLIHHDLTEMFRVCAGFDNNVNELEQNLDDIKSLLCAFTGTAAFNINGGTLHSLFQLMNANVPHEKKTIMMCKLRDLKQVTIDEISMVKKKDFDLINERCAMVRHECAEDLNFGGVAILAVGDLYQLPPVCGIPVYSRGHISNPSNFAPLLWDDFQFHELKTVMRQKDDLEFALLLNEIRTTKPEENSVTDTKLKARNMSITEDDDEYPHNALHVYAQNVHCRARNERMLGRLTGKLFKNKCRDSIKDEKINMSNFTIPDKASQTGNLVDILLLKEGARVMLTNNLDVKDGLTNGAFGTVKKIISKPSSVDPLVEEITVVLVNFDHTRVGRNARNKSAYKKNFEECVPIYRTEVLFNIKGSRTIQITRKQFPLTLAWAVTIHKTQGMTVPEIVVDMTIENGKYAEGQAYVALSRVTKYDKLHIINYNRHQIKVSPHVAKQMNVLESRRLCLDDNKIVTEKDENDIALLHLNLQGFRSRTFRKSEDLLIDEDVQKSDIVCLTETHLHPMDSFESEDVWLGKKGKVYRRERGDREKGGGIAIVVNDSLVQTESKLDMTSFECVCLQIKSYQNRHVYVILCIYLRPSWKRDCVCNELKSILQKFSHNTRVIIVGDMNENLLNGKSKLTFLADEYEYTQHVKGPTTDYGSLLDHMYTKNVNVVKSQVRDCYYSDHDKTVMIFRD